MGKNQVPRGCKRREKCKCGSFYYPTSENKYSGCTGCFPVIKREQ